jgi:hypothetical protein
VTVKFVAEDHAIDVQADAERDGEHRGLAEEVAAPAVGAP